MKWRIKKCPKCNLYTLKDLCPKCGSKTIVPHPPRFSPEDKYVEYRLRSKYPELMSKILKKNSESSTP
ncbi:RNA-protein complex protein Nop10 [Ignisphaera sp. 4213-co]|uniref:Ribosome biogenesis protein Nop10 n=1 Tax=Ignisphaera cupida TaxID=3050454 RepID=A0ABD4Z4U3_9CREN|nr:RNA-protein complex protein Nop10 [Ignisphaera sp. 4213-co]MDK6027958.1 RNA-protein complex protein Nop10 [Ignisphaera sp. 4213-co]